MLTRSANSNDMKTTLFGVIFKEATVGLASSSRALRRRSGQAGEGNPRMRALQAPTAAIQTLARLWPDSV